jgi:hypothetical protein
VSERYSPRGILEKLQKRAPSWLEQLPQRPELLLEGLRMAEPMLRQAPAAAPREQQPSSDAWRGWQLLAAAAGIIIVNPSIGRRQSPAGIRRHGSLQHSRHMPCWHGAASSNPARTRCVARAVA